MHVSVCMNICGLIQLCSPTEPTTEVTAILSVTGQICQWGKISVINVLWYGVGGQLMIQALPLKPSKFVTSDE